MIENVTLSTKKEITKRMKKDNYLNVALRFIQPVL